MTDQRVAVVGTLNLDLVIRLERRPAVGETVMGSSYRERAGGKGANQALSAAAHHPTTLVGAVGDDDAGATMLAAQRAGDVDVTHIRTIDGVSGRAFIEVDETGDNSIIVVAGANSLLTADDVTDSLDAIDPVVVLTQLESPRAVTAACAEWTRRRGRRFVLNPSPVADLATDILAEADPLVVNAGEAAHYAEVPSSALDDAGSTDRVVSALLSRAKSVVITLGGDGVIAADPERTSRVEVAQVPISDTTGAGDHFAGVLIAGLARGASVHDAVPAAAESATEYLSRRGT